MYTFINAQCSTLTFSEETELHLDMTGVCGVQASAKTLFLLLTQTPGVRHTDDEADLKTC